MGELCRKGGKFSVAYIAQGGEKEYYAASACEEIYVPPSGSLSLRGLAVAGALELMHAHTVRAPLLSGAMCGLQLPAINIAPPAHWCAVLSGLASSCHACTRRCCKHKAPPPPPPYSPRVLKLAASSLQAPSFEVHWKRLGWTLTSRG